MEINKSRSALEVPCRTCETLRRGLFDAMLRFNSYKLDRACGCPMQFSIKIRLLKALSLSHSLSPHDDAPSLVLSHSTNDDFIKSIVKHNDTLILRLTSSFLNIELIIAELEHSGGGAPAVQEGMIGKDIHKSLTPHVGCIIRQHQQAQTILEEGAVVEARHGLLQAWDWGSQRPVARTLFM